MYKIKLNGRVVEFIYNESFIDDTGWTTDQVESTDEEYKAMVNTYLSMTTARKIPLWDTVTKTIFEAVEADAEYVDRTAKLVIQKKVEVEKLKIQYGIEVRAYLGYLCEANNYTPTEYGQMLTDSDLSMCSMLLTSGALETVKSLIDAYTPTSYFTENMKTAMSAELQRFISMVNV